MSILSPKPALLPPAAEKRGIVSGFSGDSGKNSFKMPDMAADVVQGALTGGIASRVTIPQNTALPQQKSDAISLLSPSPFPVRREKRQIPEVRPLELPQVTLSTLQVERSKYLANRLINEAGFTPEQAAGIVGNLIHESQLNHQIIGGKTRMGQARGIAQWLHPARTQKFREIVGVDVGESSFEQQTDFLLWELKHTHRGAARAIRQTNTVNDATTVARTEYEKPGEEEAIDTKRKAYAYQVYDRMP